MHDNVQLALDTINQKPTRGIPTWLVHIMQHAHIERLAGVPPGKYLESPEETYLAYLHNIGVCFVDQYIPLNPLTMGDRGYESKERGATTGAEEVVLNGIQIAVDPLRYIIN